MSLDITLKGNNKSHFGIFIRENGRTKEVSLEEWIKRNPGREPLLAMTSGCCWSGNITHNLAEMADEVVNLYKALWEPEEIGIFKAKDAVPFLRCGIDNLKKNPEHFKKFNPKNGWGDYDVLIEFINEYLTACEENPEAEIEISR